MRKSKFAKLRDLYRNPFVWVLILYILWLNLYFRIDACWRTISIHRFGYVHPNYELINPGDIFKVYFCFFYILFNIIGWEVCSIKPELRDIRIIFKIIAISMFITLIAAIYLFAQDYMWVCEEAHNMG